MWLKQETKDATGSTVDFLFLLRYQMLAIDPLGHALVEEFMIHAPCRNSNPIFPCIRNGECSKHFPKSVNDDTFIDGQGLWYVMKNGVQFDDKFVVPYNMNLMKKIKAILM